MIHRPNLRRHMKGLMDLTRIKTDSVYHCLRHTFGTLFVSAGVPMESIAKMMGYTNIRTIQGYANVTDDKFPEDMDKQMGKRKNYNST